MCVKDAYADSWAFDYTWWNYKAGGVMGFILLREVLRFQKFGQAAAPITRQKCSNHSCDSLLTLIFFNVLDTVFSPVLSLCYCFLY